MKILVAGAGALGCFYGGLLARTGHDVTFLARGRTLDALASEDFRVESRIAGDFQVPVHVAGEVKGLAPPDLIMFSVKSFDLEEMATFIAPVATSNVVVLAVQNGISHPERLEELLPESVIAPAIVYVSATITEPGHVVQPGGPGQVRIGMQRAEDHALLVPVRDALLATGVSSDILATFRLPLWEKFMVICAMSGVSALTRLTLREIFDVPESRQLYYEVMAEVTDVARATGIELSRSAADRSLQMLLDMEALPLRGSMAYDLEAGKRLELATLNGTVAKMGAELNVPVPMNRAIAMALKPFEAGTAPTPA